MTSVSNVGEVHKQGCCRCEEASRLQGKREETCKLSMGAAENLSPYRDASAPWSNADCVRSTDQFAELYRLLCRLILVLRCDEPLETSSGLCPRC